MSYDPDDLSQYLGPLAYFNGTDRCDLYIEPVKASTASRINAIPEDNFANQKRMRISKFSNTSMAIDPFDKRAKMLESGGEWNCFIALRADPATREIRDQPRALEFISPDGEAFNHTFDFAYDSVDAPPTAVMVKRKKRAEKENLEALAQHMAPQLPESFADSIRLVTEEDLPAWHMDNARLLVAVQHDPVAPWQKDVHDFAVRLMGAANIADIADQFGGIRIAYRAIVREIASGTLHMVQPGRISRDSLVFNPKNGRAK